MTPLLLAREVAKVLNCSDQNVVNLAKAGKLRAVVFKAGGDRWTYRFRAEDLEAFIQANLRDGKGAA